MIDQITTDARGRFRFGLLFKTYLVFNLASTDSTNATGLGASLDVIDARIPANAREEFARGREALAKKN